MCVNRKQTGRLSATSCSLLFLALCGLLTLACVSTACLAEDTAIKTAPAKTAVALIRVAMAPEGILDDNKVNIAEYKIFRNTQSVLIRSPYVLMAALRKNEVAKLGIVRQEKDPLAWLLKELKVYYVNDSEIMRVELASKEPQEAVDLVNAIVDAYIREVVGKKERQRCEIASHLTQIYNNKENEIRSKRASLINLAEQLGASDNQAKTQTTVNIQELHALRTELIRMQMSLGKTKASLKANRAMLARLDKKPVLELELEKLAIADPVCNKLSEMIDKLQKAVELQKKQTASTEEEKQYFKHLAKQLKNLEEEYETRTSELRMLIKNGERAEIEEKIAADEVQASVLTEQAKKLSAQVDAQKTKISEIGKTSVDVEMMSKELKCLEKSLAKIHAQRERFTIETRARPRVQIFCSAYLEDTPDAKRK